MDVLCNSVLGIGEDMQKTQDNKFFKRTNQLIDTISNYNPFIKMTRKIFEFFMI
jgi:hypothetical protein